MRVSREQAAGHRERIVTEASRLFRAHGFAGVGIDGVMKAVGLTHGGFYNHFKSKDDLMVEAVAHGLAASSEVQTATELGAMLATYLSPEHRASVARGCVLAAIGPDMARQTGGVRTAVTGYVRTQIERIATMIPGRTVEARRRKAIATYAGLVGAMVLARVVEDAPLSDEILAAARETFGATGKGSTS